MVKSSGLKPTNRLVGRCCRAALNFQIFDQLVLPKSNPAFDGEFQFMWRAEEMQVIGHEQIIAHQPGHGRVLPDVMKRVLNRGLREPLTAFPGADSEEDPIRSAERSVNPFRR